MLQKNTIKYSILIPTYNKCEYLKFTLETILKNNNKNFEVIISNDYSNDDTDNLLKNIKDERVKAIKPPIKLTQAKNYEFLLNLANGEWVTILGDDDGILPNFYSTLDKLIEKYPNNEIFKFKRAIYYWENVSDIYGDRVVFYENLARKEKLKNSKIDLFLSLCGLKTAQDLPMIYTSGIIKKDLINRIKKKSKNFFFHSLIPDYYSMIALTLESKKYIFSETPIFWVGVSSKSTGRKRNIYFDKFKNQHKKVSEIDINYNLGLSGEISKIIHKIGIQSAYLFEAVLKHPYKNNFWTNKFIRNLVYSSIICNYIALRKTPNRMKVKLNKLIFFKVILKEIKLHKLSYIIIILFTLIFYILKSLFGIVKKISIYLEKKFKNYFCVKKPIILVSNDRHKFKNFVEINKYLKIK